MLGLPHHSSDSYSTNGAYATALSTVSWKYARPTPANTSEPAFGRMDYLSNLKWLSIALKPLIRDIENWPSILRYYLSRDRAESVEIRFRNHDILISPRNYSFGALAEAILTNAYRFDGSHAVVLDIGASIGDFALLASRNRDARVYAFEKDPGYFRYLKENMRLNRRHGVRTYNRAADHHTLRSIFDEQREDRIGFLKIDCEGCEYDLLLGSRAKDLSKVGSLAFEIHERPPHSKANLISHLQKSGFRVTQSERFGHGHHVFASSNL